MIFSHFARKNLWINYYLTNVKKDSDWSVGVIWSKWVQKGQPSFVTIWTAGQSSTFFNRVMKLLSSNPCACTLALYIGVLTDLLSSFSVPQFGTLVRDWETMSENGDENVNSWITINYHEWSPDRAILPSVHTEWVSCERFSCQQLHLLCIQCTCERRW